MIVSAAAALLAVVALDYPVERAARPQLLPKNVYRVDIGAAFTHIDDDEGLFRLDFGGRVGLGLGLQVHMELLRWNFSRVSGYGLEQPRVALAYGLLRGGVFELAAEAGVEIPSGGDFAGDLGLLTRLHGGRFVRVDVDLRVAGSSSDIRPESLASGRTALVLTPWAPVSLRGGTRLRVLTLTGAETLAGQVFGDVSLAFTRRSGALSAEVVAYVASPEVRLEGRDLRDPRFGHTWSGGLQLRLYFDGPTSSRRGAWGEDDVWARAAGFGSPSLQARASGP